MIRSIAKKINYSEDNLVLIEMDFALQNSYCEQVSWQESIRIVFSEFLDAINDKNDDDESSLELLSGRKFFKKNKSNFTKGKTGLELLIKKWDAIYPTLAKQYDNIKKDMTI